VKQGGLLFVFCLLVFSSPAQDVNAGIKADSTFIKIGEQIHLELILSQPKSIDVSWTVIPDTLSKLEIISKGKIDTISATDSSFLVRRQILTVTSFDSGFYVVPPFSFNYRTKGDTALQKAETEPLLITVRSIPVDTTKAIKDIKAPVEVPLTWRDFIPYFIGAGVLAAVIWLIIYLRKKLKKKPVVVIKEKPKRPAHEIAFEELKKLESEKLWQQGNFKLYHSRLSDIVRAYIEHRYPVTAMELTTEEIMEKIVQVVSNEEAIRNLKSILILADFVKFAKAIPVAYENEQSMKDAYEFINGTRLEASSRQSATNSKEQELEIRN
jgi:hypothetical protein